VHAGVRAARATAGRHRVAINGFMGMFKPTRMSKKARAGRRALALHRTSVACLILCLVTVGGVYVEAQRQVTQSEDRALSEEGETVRMISQQIISRMETTIASVHSVAVAAGGDGVAFERAIRPGIDAGIFSAAVFLAEDGGRLATVGRPALPATLPPDQVNRLHEAVTSADIVWIGRFTTGLMPRLGFAYGPGSGARHAVTYVEVAVAALPKLLGGVQSFGTDGIGKVQLALYAGPEQRSEDLLFSLARRVPIEGHTHTVRIRVGSTEWTVVLAPAISLISGMERATPWILLGLGLLASLLVAAIVEVTRRRRDALAAREERDRKSVV
jgi:hypothetical protein